MSTANSVIKEVLSQVMWFQDNYHIIEKHIYIRDNSFFCDLIE